MQQPRNSKQGGCEKQKEEFSIMRQSQQKKNGDEALTYHHCHHKPLRVGPQPSMIFRARRQALKYNPDHKTYPQVRV